MNCMNCGAFLADKDLDYCPHCGCNVLIQKKVEYLSKLYYNQGLEKASIRDLSGAVNCLKQSLTFPAKSQGIIIFSYCLINSIQFIRIRLKTINIFIRNIPGRLQILTDHPLAKSSNHLSHFKIHKPQKISRLDILDILQEMLRESKSGRRMK